jgi:peroxiredoxin Q/BCP
LLLRSTESELKVGDKAPNFCLPSANDGKEICLSDFLGKSNVVLYFYPKDESIGCTKEACSFRDGMEKFKRYDAEVIGINADTVESHKSFATNHNLPFILLSDSRREVIRAYGAKARLLGYTKRITYVIDKQGVIRKIISSMRPSPHVEQSLEVLQSLEGLP